MIIFKTMEINPPKIEKLIGMEVYKSHSEGTGGRIKVLPEDFVVEEITTEGEVVEVGEPDAEAGSPGSEGEYLHATLQKYNWDTLKAVKEISKRLHVSDKRIGYAGTKDKRALTAQRISLWKTKKEDAQKLLIKDIILKDYKYSDYRINLGDLSGNRFTVTIRDITGDPAHVRESIEKTISELRGQAPSFYGVQRFGTIRPITHLVGREIVKGNFEEAIKIYLAKDYEAEKPQTRAVRRRLAETWDLRGALRDFPPHLGYENALLNFLINDPDNYIGAFRTLPKNLAMLFVHAYQSYIFNKALSEYIRRNIPVEKLPLPGFATKLDEITAKLLAEEGIEAEQFRVVEAPYLGSKGEYRECFIPVEGLAVIEVSEDELNPEKTKACIRFTLQKGNYATVLLREIMKN